jgi:glycosyltransferase involved in cell wall biosynthesis
MLGGTQLGWREDVRRSSPIDEGVERNAMRGRRVHSDVDDLRIHGTWGPPRMLAVPSETGASRMVERRLIAVVPAYNEAPTVEGVLTRLYPMVDGLIIVDDGSRDETRAIVTRWIADKPHASLIAFDANRGLSAGYGAAFRFVRAEVAAGRLDAGDLILTVDADGQHDPDDVTALVAALERGGLDGLMARRDFSLYPAYKKAGNWVMSAWATIWSGQRFYDVESGYRVFRAGPLGEATRYYEGYRYSETVELAMILPRLGYKLGNNHLVPVPVYRSNTRMKDVLIDLIAMPCAWWRVMTQRARPAGIRERWAPWLPGFFFALLLATLLLVAVKRIFLGDDSMSVYAHVWFIQDRLWSGHGIPRTIGVLDDGRAVTFPYALVPWLLGALLWPLFHNWGVTLLMVIAAVGTPVAASFARPVMRDPWVMLLFLLNPFYLDGVLAFQFPFLWSAFFFFLFVIALDREWDGAAGVLLWLCITTHPLAGGIGALCYLAVHFLTEPERRLRFFVLGLIAGIASLPAILLARGTPALAENSLRVIVSSIADGFVRRATVLAFPFLATALVVYVRRWYRPIFAVWIAGLIFTLFIVNGAFGYAQGGYGGLFRQSHDMYAPYFASAQFDPQATYRVMEPNQYEDGQYYFLRHGARLANEFFSESMFRRSWTEGEYRDFLTTKQIDYVSIERGYLAQYHTNEQQLLDALTQRDLAHAVYRDPAQRYVIYDVRAFRVAGIPTPRPPPDTGGGEGASRCAPTAPLPCREGLGVG